jgi:hypothetical protein
MYNILNPHIIDFVAEPVLYKLAKRRPLKKYGYLISEAIKKYGSISILVDSGASGFIPMSIYVKLPYFLRLLFSKIEISWWKRRNNFTGEVKIFYKPTQMQDKKNLVFFTYKHYKNPLELAKTCAHFKNCIAHLSHYHNDTQLQSNALKQIENIHLAADVNIADNAYFKKYFDWYKKKIFILPFAVEDRFIEKGDWQLRKNKALSIGTFHFLEESFLSGKAPELKDFYETTKAKALHPLRRAIFEKKDTLTDHIDCMNSPYIETKKGNSFWHMFAPKNMFAGQKKYFSFNIVDKFNEYKFAIVGEELITGLPGIGTFEALACGCIVIGDKSAYGSIEHTNLIQIEGLTIEKAIATMQNTIANATHICNMRDSNNFQLVENQLNNI